MNLDNHFETFVPLYITNKCDSKCTICNMRQQNKNLIRIQGSKKAILEQLKIIYTIENISSICILSGEYIRGKKRKENLNTIIWTIKEAFKLGYEQVFINIGSLYDDEIKLLTQEFSNDQRIILSLFQETYNKECYETIFGKFSYDNPKSNFDLRISTLERWINAGFKKVDIGILLGLNEIDFDKKELINHAKKLHGMGAKIYISLPRIIGINNLKFEVSDYEFIKIIEEIRNECPWAKLIITTRESIETMKKVLKNINVISPGSSDVLPYTYEGGIPNNILTSQFFVKNIRKRPSEVLDQIKYLVGKIKYYNK